MKMDSTHNLIELLQRTVPKGFYGELSFVFQDSKVVLIRENKTFKPQLQTDRSDRKEHEESIHR
jgi:hypothetical protein